MDKVGFETNRNKYATHCPCGKQNKGKFAPFKGQEPNGMAAFGKCFSCGDTFFFPEEKEVKKGIGAGNVGQKFVFPEELTFSQTQIKHDNFFKFLSGMWGDVVAKSLFLENNLGTTKERTTFWLINGYGQLCQPKDVAYTLEGKRDKSVSMGVRKGFTQAYNYFPCAFNEVNAVLESDKVIGVVESEKTAVLCSHVYPELVWVGAGGATAMSPDKIMPLSGRDVLLFMDADEAGRDAAGSLLTSFRKKGCTVQDVDLFPEATNGYDLADFIVEFHKDGDKLDEIRKKMSDQIEALHGKNVHQLDSGIYRVNNQLDYMLDSFRNGKKTGETTHFMEIDSYFKWKKGLIGTWTGYPNSGKSEFLLSLSLLKSLKDDWRHILYVPESMSSHGGSMNVEEVVDTLAHTLVGKTTDPAREEQMSEGEYKEALDFINRHFVFIYPEVALCTPSILLEHAEYLITSELRRGDRFDNMIIDPWNNMVFEQDRNETIDRYIIRELIGFKHFSVKEEICTNFVVHPNSPAKGKNGEVPPANAFMLNGGAGFNNKSDFINSIHRPDWFKERIEVRNPDGSTKMKADGVTPMTYNGRNSTKVDFHSLKMKNQKLMGTILGSAELDFSRKQNRYLPLNSVVSPFDEGYGTRVDMREPFHREEPPKNDEQEDLPF